MTSTDIAKLIPAEYRKEILDLKMIEHAQAIQTNDDMHYLFTIWKNYIEPGIEMDCGLCIQRILGNYKQLLPVLITLEKDLQLLNEVD
jgi:hypothetical protein